MKSITTPAAAESDTLATLAESINAEHDAALQAARSAIEHARRCGQLLIDAKAKIGHGDFLAWIKANCRVGDRQARNYMRLAEHWDRIVGKTEPGSDLTIKRALRLIGKREPTFTDLDKQIKAAGDEAAEIVHKLGDGINDWIGEYVTLDNVSKHGWQNVQSMLTAEFYKLKARQLELAEWLDGIATACDERIKELRRDAVPELNDTDVLRCNGADDTFALIVPYGDGYFYVGVVHAPPGEQAYVDEIARGIIGYAVPDFFKRHGFRGIADWTRAPITDADRQIVAEAREHRANTLYGVRA